ncbi:MAG: OmpA family protein, partial [Flavitalea sp.]
TNDSVPLNTAQATQKDSSKKKLDTASKETSQQKNIGYDKTLRRDNDNNTPAYNNTAVSPQQQVLSADAYEAYMQQSERLQADIERLERQMAYNRSFANTIARQPNYNPTVNYNVSPPPNNFYPVTVPVSTQKVRDTIIIHDTVFVTKTDTITKEVQIAPAPVIAAVPQEKIVEERIDYKKLPPENILFATGKAVIGQVYIQKLNYLAIILKENPELMIAITGHTDKTGSPAVNELLSLKRANAVKTFFVRKGINETRMQLTAVASVDPLVAGESKNANTQNRRVEIKIL